MSAVGGVFKLAVRNWLFREDYDWAKGRYRSAGGDREVAVIREYLAGEIAGVRLNAQDANAVVSMAQTLKRAAATIRDKLASMEVLAEKAVHGYYTSKDRASMQKQVQNLARDINSIVDSTQYNGNKLFTDKGRVIKRSIGKDRTIRLFAKDLRFDTSKVDLVGDAKASLKTIKKAVKEAGEYTLYLGSQNMLLQNAMANIEVEMASAAGVDVSDFKTKTMEQFLSCLSSQRRCGWDSLFKAQSNIASDEVLRLLKHED
jgi:flagellin